MLSKTPLHIVLVGTMIWHAFAQFGNLAQMQESRIQIMHEMKQHAE